MLTILYLTNLIKITYCRFIVVSYIAVSYIALNCNVFVLCIELVELQQEKPVLKRQQGVTRVLPHQ